MPHLSSRLLLPLVVWAAGAADVDSPPSDAIDWRPFERSTFEEARATGRSVFLLLTAPWNWDHFLLRRRYFADPEVVRLLDAYYIAVHADVTVYPELREMYSLRSGLVPSFHFLDAEGRAYATFPPLPPEEFVYYLEDLKDLRDAPTVPPLPTPEPVLLDDAKLADRLARVLLDDFAAGEAAANAVHLDFDPSALSFLLEYGVAHPDRRDAHRTVDAELRSLLAGEMFDEVDGGFHRAAATPDRQTIHREKLLRPNAELGGVLASRYRMTGEDEFGVAALQTLQFFNRRLKKQNPTLYAGSLAADVYGPDRSEIRMDGEHYYRLNAAMRGHVGVPPVSQKIPVGANFVLQQALVAYLRAFEDERMTQPARWSGDILRAGGLEPAGLAARSVGREGSGCLRDQGDAGSGLLALHAIAGNPRALEAAVRLAGVATERFRGDGNVFLGVERDGPWPDFVRDAPAIAAWNGTFLRFLAELAAVTGEARWREIARESLSAWAERIPSDGRGIGELGRAALRVEEAVPLLVIVADPDSERGGELRDVAFRLYDPLVAVRWIAPADRDALAAFGIDADEDPAIYLRWDRLSRPIGDSVLLRAVYEDARDRVRGE